MKNDVSMWKELINNDDEFKRLEALDNPPLDSSDEIVSSIIERLSDKSENVRQAAAEALCNFDVEDARTALRACIANENSELVKEYAISSLGVIATFEDLKLLIELLKTERNPEILIHVCTGIVVASRKISIDGLLKYVRSDSPALKSSAINALLFSCFNADYDDVLHGIDREIKKSSNEKLKVELENAFSKFEKLQGLML